MKDNVCRILNTVLEESVTHDIIALAAAHLTYAD